MPTATRIREISFARPLLAQEERAAVLEVLSGTTLVQGPKSREFEEAFGRFTGAAHAVSVSSCTAAMHLAYEAWGIGEGDEVIVPAQTHTATAHAVLAAGATPVFVDSEFVTGNIDIDRIESVITERTRAIAVVHFLGLPADMDRIVSLARLRNLKVLEDCALALGATYKGQHVGCLGDAGCFSFYPVKHITCAEGGMLVTKDRSLADRVASTRAFGVDKTPAERAEPGVYDVTMHGYNYRLNEIQAAIGVEQLRKAPAWLQQRQRNARVLREALSDLSGIINLGEGSNLMESAAYCHSIVVDAELGERAAMAARLRARGIGTSVYYPRPVPHMTYYRHQFGYRLDSFPVAARISYRSIALPVGPHLSEEDVAYMADQVKDVCTR